MIATSTFGKSLTTVLINVIFSCGVNSAALLVLLPTPTITFSNIPLARLIMSK